MEKYTVATDSRGKIVGTQVGHEGEKHPESGAILRLVAGPGQVLHKVEFDKSSLENPSDVEEFHRQLTQNLKDRPPL